MLTRAAPRLRQMGGKDFRKHPVFREFLKLALRAYNVLRAHANTIIDLCLLVRARMCGRASSVPAPWRNHILPQMVPAGLVELQSEQDLQYVRDTLCLDCSLQEDPAANARRAEERFKAELERSLDTTWRLIDDVIHDNVCASLAPRRRG